MNKWRANLYNKNTSTQNSNPVPLLITLVLWISNFYIDRYDLVNKKLIEKRQPFWKLFSTAINRLVVLAYFWSIEQKYMHNTIRSKTVIIMIYIRQQRATIHLDPWKVKRHNTDDVFWHVPPVIILSVPLSSSYQTIKIWGINTFCSRLL